MSKNEEVQVSVHEQWVERSLGLGRGGEWDGDGERELLEDVGT